MQGQSSPDIQGRNAPKREAGDFTHSVAIINACKAYHWRDKSPPPTHPAKKR